MEKQEPTRAYERLRRDLENDNRSENQEIWRWIAAALLATTMGLCGYVGGAWGTNAEFIKLHNALATEVNVNGNRITALETQMTILQDIRSQLNEMNSKLDDHILTGNK